MSHCSIKFATGYQDSKLDRIRIQEPDSLGLRSVINGLEIFEDKGERL